MILFNLCDNSGILMVFLIIKYTLQIVCVVVPIILIFRSIVPFFKTITSGESITKELKPLITSFVAGFIVFMLPGLFNFIFTSLIPADSTMLTACFNKATIENINSLRAQEEQERKNEVKNNRDSYEESAKKQAEEQERINAEIKKRREEQERLQRENVNSDNPRSSGSGIWQESIFPLPSGASSCRSSVFGPRNHPITGAYENHSGDDYPAACGTSVYAVLDGTVVQAANDGGYHGGMGNYVKIQHNDGTSSVYMHSSNVLVSVGQSVKKGQEIMKVGTTGSSTGCHLHVTIKNEAGTNVAPSNYIPTLPSCS